MQSGVQGQRFDVSILHSPARLIRPSLPLTCSPWDVAMETDNPQRDQISLLHLHLFPPFTQSSPSNPRATCSKLLHSTVWQVWPKPEPVGGVDAGGGGVPQRVDCCFIIVSFLTFKWGGVERLAAFWQRIGWEDRHKYVSFNAVLQLAT